MRDDRERWMLGTSYHKAMEDYLGVALIRSGRHRYRQENEVAKVQALLNKGGTA